MSALSTLLTLTDSRLPTGGHVHSGGVEEAVTSGLVVDLATLEAYLRRRVRTSGLVTASIAAAVHRGQLSVDDPFGQFWLLLGLDKYPVEPEHHETAPEAVGVVSRAR